MKVGSQEIPEVTGKFGLGVKNEAEKRLTEFCQGNKLVIASTLSNNTRDDSTHGHHQMVNAEIRLIIFFTAKDGEALCSQQKQDRELTVAQIMNPLLLNSDLYRRKEGKPLDHSGMNHMTTYDYTVEVRNRFKGLDVIDRVLDELWTEVHDIIQETGIKTIPKKKKGKKGKMAV